MKIIEPPKGQFKTQFGLVFNYQCYNPSISVELPEGRKCCIRGKVFTQVKVHFKWDGERWTIDPKPSFIKREELMTDPTRAQFEEIHEILNKDFRAFWKNDLFIAKKHAAYKRYLHATSLLEERQRLESQNESNLNRIKQINEELTKYL